jgi:hypothetical protein
VAAGRESIARIFATVLNNYPSAIRIMVGEMTDKSNQTIGFSGLSLNYRLGQIMGMLLTSFRLPISSNLDSSFSGYPMGGFLAHPERHFSVFNTKFWLAYPFALPGFVGSAFSMCAVVVGFFFLKEVWVLRFRVLKEYELKTLCKTASFGNMLDRLQKRPNEC